MLKQIAGGLVIVLVGVGLLGGAYLGPYSTHQEVQTHETTDGEVLSSSIESATEEEEGETEVEYYPRIEYEYTVDGTTYTGERIFHGSQIENEPGELEGKEFDAENDARDALGGLEAGDTTQVYYDPDDPEVSYLRDPSGSLLQSAGIMGVFGLVFGGAGVVTVLRRD